MCCSGFDPIYMITRSGQRLRSTCINADLMNIQHQEKQTRIEQRGNFSDGVSPPRGGSVGGAGSSPSGRRTSFCSREAGAAPLLAATSQSADRCRASQLSGGPGRQPGVPRRSAPVESRRGAEAQRQARIVSRADRRPRADRGARSVTVRQRIRRAAHPRSTLKIRVKRSPQSARGSSSSEYGRQLLPAEERVAEHDRGFRRPLHHAAAAEKIHRWFRCRLGNSLDQSNPCAIPRRGDE